MGKYCGNCGNQMAQDEKFCAICGTKFESNVNRLHRHYTFWCCSVLISRNLSGY